MALISCSECGKEISDKAASCPNCGVPIVISPHESSSPGKSIKVTRTGALWEGIGFLLIVAGIIIAMATGSENHIGGLMAVSGFVLFIIGRFK